MVRRRRRLYGRLSGSQQAVSLELTWGAGGYRVGKCPRRLEAPKDLCSTLQRVRCNVPLMSCTKLDELFRLYLLALLIEMQGAEGKEVPIPSTIAVKECNANEHRSYVKTLGNLTSASYGLAKDLLR